MPRSESTIASAGPSCSARGDVGLDRARARRRGARRRGVSTSARPSLGFTPMRSNVSPCFANTSAKYVFTAWPKRIGSETFIIVALRWIENSTSLRLGVRPSARRGTRRAPRALMKVASTISPARTGIDSLSTVTVPSRATSSTFRSSSAAKVTDCSLERKSSWPIVATLRLRVGRPRAHLVRVRPGVVLHRRRRAAVGVALAQHRVDRRALHLVVAGLDVVLLGRATARRGSRAARSPWPGAPRWWP